MKLICIYGPPATGKLTVARELSKLTGYKVFHNHLTVDLVESIFDRGMKQFDELIDRYRLELIEAAAKSEIEGLIVTYVYSKPHDDEFVGEIVEIAERNRGKVVFVQLFSHPKELEKRVKHPARKLFTKIETVKKLREVMRKSDLLSSVPHPQNLSIDNTRLSPKTVAKKIKEHYKL